MRWQRVSDPFGVSHGRTGGGDEESAGRKALSEDWEIREGREGTSAGAAYEDSCKIRGEGVPVAGVGPRRSEGSQVTVRGEAGVDESDIVAGEGVAVEAFLRCGRVVSTAEVETVALSGAGRLAISRRGRATRLAAG